MMVVCALGLLCVKRVCYYIGDGVWVVSVCVLGEWGDVLMGVAKRLLGRLCIKGWVAQVV